MVTKDTKTRSRKAVGPERPVYLGSADVDRVMSMMMALITEIAALRERLDTHERLGTANLMSSTDTVEAYRADAMAEEERDAWRDGYIRRVFRVITEDIEGLMPPSDPSSERKPS